MMKSQRWMFRLFLILALVFVTGFSPSGKVLSQSKAVLLKISPESSVAACNDLIIAVRVENVSQLTGYSIQIAFTPGSLEILEVTNGGFLDEGFYEPTNGFDNTAGTISFGMVRVEPSLPVDGNGDLVHIRLRALTSGASIPFTIDTGSILVSWPDVLPIDYVISNGTVFTASQCLYLPVIRR
jgi:hypothetical protein